MVVPFSEIREKQVGNSEFALEHLILQLLGRQTSGDVL